MKKYILFLRKKLSPSVFMNESGKNNSNFIHPNNQKRQFKQKLTLCLFTLIFVFGFMPILGAQNLTDLNEPRFKQEQIIKPRQDKPVNLSVKEKGIIISVSAPNSVLPHDTELKVKLLSDSEKQEYINKLEIDNRIELNQSLAFDITLHNNRGDEIQPNGEVTVGFSGVEFTHTDEQVTVYHVEE
ncbi:MAG: hypothetical protein LC658_06325, partial [Bacteroidales bacterium]|nr:hypothetical protein [Bacteroidales bacterium]